MTTDPFQMEDPSIPEDQLPPPPVAALPAPPGAAARDQRFKRVKGSDAMRLANIEDFLEALDKDFAIVYESWQNSERAKLYSSELIEYRCLGLLPNHQVCGNVIRAKRPEARSYEERIICPNHGGDPTPLEPIGL
jgi:hypothetical protein